jgi:hypothetical protein
MHGQREGGGVGGGGGAEGGGGFVPSAALLRAVLINGAQDMSKKGGRVGSKGARLLPAPSMVFIFFSFFALLPVQTLAKFLNRAHNSPGDRIRAREPSQVAPRA